VLIVDVYLKCYLIMCIWRWCYFKNEIFEVVWFKYVLYKDVIFEDVWFIDVLYKDMIFDDGAI